MSEPWVGALDGIEAFERIEVLYWLHESRRDLVRQSPGNDGMTKGTFTIRSPVRPNPIGTSIVSLVSREGPALNVRGLDCVDGTPLLDLKPARSSSEAQPRRRPKAFGKTDASGGADATGAGGRTTALFLRSPLGTIFPFQGH